MINLLEPMALNSHASDGGYIVGRYVRGRDDQLQARQRVEEVITKS